MVCIYTILKNMKKLLILSSIRNYILYQMSFDDNILWEILIHRVNLFSIIENYLMII